MTISASSTTGRGKGRKPTTDKPATKRKAPSRTKGTTHKTVADPREPFTDEEWNDMVATAAYYRAEARGFDPGSPEDDWYEAEAELREQLAAAEQVPEPGEGPDANEEKTRGED